MTTDADDTQTSTATATGKTDEGEPVEAEDDATVTIVGIPSNLTLVKTVEPDVVFEPGEEVIFTVMVTNESPTDNVTITALTDSIENETDVIDLIGLGNCSEPQFLEPGESYVCSYPRTVAGNAGDIEIVDATDQLDE